MGLLLVLWVVLTLTLGGIGIVDLIGWVLLYFVGLAWVSFLIELGAKQIEARRSADKELNGNSSWNPLDPASQFYGVLPSTVFFLDLQLPFGSRLTCSNRISTRENSGPMLRPIC